LEKLNSLNLEKKESKKENKNICIMYIMPFAMKMNLVNSNAMNAKILASLQQKNSKAVAPAPTPSLGGPMIGRIHNIKPGCGSCGRH